jgi:NAD(P)-dependent dehydrogenase (short-subunit alcohol dehydrogenase family)
MAENSFTQNPVAVITGAASGIGRGLALRMAREKASLALSDVNESGLRETVEMAAKLGVKVTADIVDVADRQQVEGFAARVAQEHGRATYLFNNAGVGILGTVEELSLEDYEWLMGVNFWGVVYGVKAFLPLLQAERRAHIVNISSVFGFFAPAGQSSYCASKFAVRGFTESLRHELAGGNIVVSTVHPGGIRTNIARASRVGAGANAEEKPNAIRKFDKVARTSPEKAAETIVRGMLAGKPRILVGPDAWILDKLVRLLPVKYWPLIKSQMEWR